ncbi:glucose-1-phosphate cytidylyltransferase [Sphingomonas bacterium]|uniref:glucose-1-phosphate cytidylyltransferase n=1 Tax=Sphingomonas bacterium TaxID=1895847 RepID=UPI0015767FFB|nr:glucose-1-phosphate cytidylyltransferase [Sphingomonas bacterium]
MKAVLFAGGFGTRLSEETAVTPKPMVEIGGRPILWHIMKTYAHYGIRDFVVLGGYKVESIRSYFLNYQSKTCDLSINLRSGRVEWLSDADEDWQVTIIDTGLDCMTGGRLKRARHLLQDGPFCLTYGDGVSDVDIPALVAAHHASDAWCTLTAVSQPGRFGALKLSDDAHQVQGFSEKGATEGGMINGGFFVCQPDVFDVIDGDQTVFEAEPMVRMIERGKLGCHMHTGFWQSMDTLRDKHVLDAHWSSGSPPWKVWSDEAQPGVSRLRRTA